MYKLLSASALGALLTLPLVAFPLNYNQITF